MAMSTRHMAITIGVVSYAAAYCFAVVVSAAATHSNCGILPSGEIDFLLLAPCAVGKGVELLGEGSSARDAAGVIVVLLGVVVVLPSSIRDHAPAVRAFFAAQMITIPWLWDALVRLPFGMVSSVGGIDYEWLSEGWPTDMAAGAWPLVSMIVLILMRENETKDGMLGFRSRSGNKAILMSSASRE